MSDHLFDWDPAQSRAVVMGTWKYKELPGLPAAGNSLDRFAGLLTGSLCGWPSNKVTRVANEEHSDVVDDLLMREFSKARDVALFYYVGHGQIDQMDELCLALPGSIWETTERRATTSLTFKSVRTALLASKAKTKIVILDCCRAGQAVLPHNTLSGAVSVLANPSVPIADKAATTGAYVMAAAGPYDNALVEEDVRDPQTLFTKYMADIVEEGVRGAPAELTLGTLFAKLEQRLTDDGHPRPQERSVNYGHNFVFARNAAYSGSARKPGLRLVPPASPAPAPPAPPAVDRPYRERPAENARRRFPRRSLAAGIGSVIVVLAAVGTALALTRTPHATASAGPLTHAFTAADEHGLFVKREWTVTGSTDPVFTERLEATNPTDFLVQAPFEEPLPAVVAAALAKARFTPENPQIVDSGHVLDWQLRVAPHNTVTYEYTVPLGSAGVSATEFGQWVTEFSTANVGGGPSAKPAKLESLSIQQRGVHLTVGGTIQLTLSGVLPTGQKASAAVLASATWSSAKTSVVTVTQWGEVVAVGRGRTVVVARIGGATASIEIVVSARTTANPSTPGSGQPPGTQQPDTSPPTTGGASPSASPNPTASTPTSKPTPSTSPTAVVTTTPPTI